MSTIAAIATPLAAGGLGVIRISGEDAIILPTRYSDHTAERALKK